MSETRVRGDEHWLAVARLGFERHLARVAGLRKVSAQEIARSTGMAPSRAKRILRGEEGDLSLTEMTRLARSVGGVLDVTIHADGEEVSWVLTIAEAKRLLEDRERRYGPDAALNSDPPTALEPSPSLPSTPDTGAEG